MGIEKRASAASRTTESGHFQLWGDDRKEKERGFHGGAGEGKTGIVEKLSERRLEMVTGD